MGCRNNFGLPPKPLWLTPKMTLSHLPKILAHPKAILACPKNNSGSPQKQSWLASENNFGGSQKHSWHPWQMPSRQRSLRGMQLWSNLSSGQSQFGKKRKIKCIICLTFVGLAFSDCLYFGFNERFSVRVFRGFGETVVFTSLHQLILQSSCCREHDTVQGKGHLRSQVR